MARRCRVLLSQAATKTTVLPTDVTVIGGVCVCVCVQKCKCFYALALFPETALFPIGLWFFVFAL